MMKLTVIVVCLTILGSLFYLYNIGKLAIFGLQTLTELSPITRETIIELSYYFGEVKSTDGDELIVAKITNSIEYNISDTQREYWTSLIFDKGISLGTNTVKIRCPVHYKYYIKISDPWEINLKNDVIYIRQPIIRQLIPPSILIDRLEVETDRGWARLPTDKLEKDALRDYLGVATIYGNRSLDKIKKTANESIEKFINNWLKNLKGIDITGVTIIFVDRLSGFGEENLIINSKG